MKNITVKRIQAFGHDMFDFHCLVTDLQSNLVFWVNECLDFYVYKNFSKYIKNEYELRCDGDIRKELIINLVNIDKIKEFIILKDGNIEQHAKKISNDEIEIRSDFYNGKLNASMSIKIDNLPRFIKIIRKFKNLSFNEKIQL